jgi:hypothetical protein
MPLVLELERERISKELLESYLALQESQREADDADAEPRELEKQPLQDPYRPVLMRSANCMTV